MSPLRVSIVGAGKRVLETALPALRAAGDLFQLHAVFARSERSLTIEGDEKLAVRALSTLSDRDVAATDVFYVAVGKASIGAVLSALTRFDVSKKTLFLDTPVLLWKQIHHLAKIERFGKAGVPEDCVALPWYDVVKGFQTQRGLSAPRNVTFYYSAYKYHGLAMAKTLLEDERIVAASIARKRLKDGEHVSRVVSFARGGVAKIHEPRNYATGWTALDWDGVSLVSGPREYFDSARGTASSAYEPVFFELLFRNDRCVGFRAGDARSDLDDAEQGLQLCRGEALSLTARMEDWKRIGFLRLLRRLARGEAGYPVIAGIDDSLVDWQLDKFGRYRRNPFTTIDRPSGRRVMAAVSRLLGKG